MQRPPSVLLLVLAAGCAAPGLERYEDARPKMGTEFRIVLYAPDEASAERAWDAAWLRIDAIEARLSDFRSESELSRLSASSRGTAPTSPVQVSDDLWHVLVEAQRVAAASAGAFDVTVGPCVRLWRRAVRQGELPDPARLALAREAVGREHLLLNPTDRTVQLLRRDMRLDLGGIAKGYALDQALAELARHGIASALVDGGGDLALGAAPPGSAGWRVHIEGAAEDSCLLERAGLATSGDAYRYFEWQGRRYSHIVDPRTGFGLTSGVSASVVAESAMRADALASAACVLGLPDGLAWIEAQVGAEARLRGPPKEGGLAPCESSGFRRRMRLPPAP